MSLGELNLLILGGVLALSLSLALAIAEILSHLACSVEWGVENTAHRFPILKQFRNGSWPTYPFFLLVNVGVGQQLATVAHHADE
jgi:hypothetical protein